MEWIQNRKILVNEESDPKVGDHVYFGIHDLIRNNFNLDRDSMHSKMGQITDVDPVKERIKVSADQNPWHLGYRKLESPTDRKRKKMSKDGRSEVSIPHHDCKDISDMVGDGSKVWLVVDRNTKYQTGLNHKLNQFKYMSKGGPSYMTGDTNMPQMNTAANPNMQDPSMADQINPAMVPHGPNGQQQFGMGQQPMQGQPMQGQPQQPPGMPKQLPTMQLGMRPNSKWQQVNRNVSYMNKECYDPLANIGWKNGEKEEKFYKYY